MSWDFKSSFTKISIPSLKQMSFGALGRGTDIREHKELLSKENVLSAMSNKTEDSIPCLYLQKENSQHLI